MTRQNYRKVDFWTITSLKNLRSCRFDLWRFLAYLMALKAAADVNQVAGNVNLGVKAITDMKKSAKATADVKPLKSTLTRSVD